MWLDVWYFICRFSSAYTTDTHPLYSVFLSKLSTCIFEWDAGDPALLREAKPVQLGGKGMAFADVSQHITRKELEKHCRRCTRGTDKTTILIQALIDVLDPPSGCDTTGMRLSNRGMSAASRTSRGTSCAARLVLRRRVGCSSACTDAPEARLRWRVSTATSSTSYQVMTLVISMLREYRSCNVVLCCRSHIVCNVARSFVSSDC